MKFAGMGLSTEKISRDDAPIISVVSPVYLAAPLVEELVRRIKRSLEPITDKFEIILVEDGSPDKSWDAIVRVVQKETRVCGVQLSRNYGQHYAISAGLSLARGQWIVVMDCDLQDQPEEIGKLYQRALEGYDIVYARRHVRQDDFFKRYFSLSFYRLLNYLSDYNHDPAIANFGIYGRKVVDAVNQMPEKIRFFPVMVKWVGFTSSQIDVEHARRAVGKSSYNLKKLINLGIDIILSNSDKPIRLVVKTGFLVSIFGFVYGLVTIVLALMGQIKVLGYASLIVSLWVLAGLLMLVIGVVGLYVGKVFDGVKNRPAYIIREIFNRQ